MSFTPYNAPLLSGLLGDRKVASFFGVKADLDAMLKFEIELASAQAKLGMISDSQAGEITAVLSDFEPDIQQLAIDTTKDGMAVPGLVRQLRNALSEDAAKALHYRSTSQDVIDTSAMLRMKQCHVELVSRLEVLASTCEGLNLKHGQNDVMAYTRMQAALPIKVQDRLGNWLNPIEQILADMQKDKEEVFKLQLGGPVGGGQAYDGKANQIAEIMAPGLGLQKTASNWQNDRSIIVGIGNRLSMLTGHLGKIGQDICLMAQLGDDQIILKGGGSSSAMSHKQNPVLAETLVTIARFNSGQVGCLHSALLHEQERSGAAWMIEWMILPQMYVTAAAALRNIQNQFEMIERIGK